MTPALRPAVFLDRDGVLNRIVWRDGKPASPRLPEEFEIEPQAAAALEALQTAGYALFVVTNQPDIARGRMSQAALNAMHAHLSAALPVEAVSACLHDDADACACRKPKPGQLLALAHRHGLDLSLSWMVGDQNRDIACGRAAGCSTVLLARSYNSSAGADVVADELWQAVCTITATGAAKGHVCL
ncbi:MAG: D-glycero-alpha-D-manno-heptose-1,7-bisphosphate 7-phosphatase [Caulobacteraceae bacterium]